MIHQTNKSLGPAYSSCPLASTISQDFPAHILECPCPAWPFQCEMGVSKVQAWATAWQSDRHTPLAPRKHRVAPSVLCRNSNCSRGQCCGLLASGWHKSGDGGQFVKGDGSSIKDPRHHEAHGPAGSGARLLGVRRAKIACAADDSLIKQPKVGKCFQTALPRCLSGPCLGWGRPLAILEGGTHWLGGRQLARPSTHGLQAENGRLQTADRRLQTADCRLG